MDMDNEFIGDAMNYKVVVEQLIKDIGELGYEIHSIKKEFGYIFMQMSKTARLTSERIDLLNKKLDRLVRYKETDISHH